MTYNPWGADSKDYNWTFPKYYFDISNPKRVLIGKDYWDFIGGDGCYEQFLGICKKIGKERKEEIKRKLLGDIK